MGDIINKIVEAVNWVIANKEMIISVIAQIIAVASIIVKLTPTLADDNIFLPVVKFIGKYIALNKSVNPEDRPVSE